MYNTELRSTIKHFRLYNYEVAAEMGIPETSFSRMISRGEMSADKKKEVLSAINRLTSKMEGLYGKEEI